MLSSHTVESMLSTNKIKHVRNIGYDSRYHPWAPNSAELCHNSAINWLLSAAEVSGWFHALQQTWLFHWLFLTSDIDMTSPLIPRKSQYTSQYIKIHLTSDIIYIYYTIIIIVIRCYKFYLYNPTFDDFDDSISRWPLAWWIFCAAPVWHAAISSWSWNLRHQSPARNLKIVKVPDLGRSNMSIIYSYNYIYKGL